MNKHLTADQFSEAVTGRPSLDTQAHLEHCHACSEQLATLSAALGEFNATVHTWSEREYRLRGSAPSLSKYRWPAVAALAFSSLAVTIFVGSQYVHKTEITAVSAAPSDAALLNQIDLDISRPVPARLQPLFVTP